MKCCCYGLRGVVMMVCLLVLTTTTGAAEWEALFAGKSLSKWDVRKCEAEIQDGCILLKSGNGLVQSKKRYTNYVLDLEWRALKPDKWDSGIYFAYTQVAKGRPWPAKYQVNLRKGQEGNLGGLPGGDNTVKLDAHQWNRFQLTVQGTTAVLTVNGKTGWRVKGLPVGGGYIALQAEVPLGGQFLFRNIRIRELPANQPE